MSVKRIYVQTSAVIAIAMTASLSMAASDSSAERGRRIFHGQEAVTGKIDGHTAALPAALGKCVSCHHSGPSSKLEQRSAPPLNRASLLEYRSRRGGPKYTYDKAGFCKTVRTGLDPQYVTLLRAMPRFDLNAEQCDALWRYLMESRHE